MGKLLGYLKRLKDFRWRLFISLSLTALIPAVYQTVRTFIISTSISVEGLDVIGQMEWFDLINETLLAFLVVPLYSLFNKIKDDRDDFPKLVFKVGLLIIAIYLLFQLGVYVYAQTLVTGMNPAEVDVGAVAAYLQIETIAFMVGILSSIGNVIFIVLGKDLYVYALLAVKAVTLVISDFVLVPAYGAMGVAYTNILVNGLLGLAVIVILVLTKNVKPSLPVKSDLAFFKKWAKVGLFAGSQSLLDNLIYALMVVKMVNMVMEQGNYWVANNFIWGYLLIPITALGEVIKHDAKDYRSLKQSNYYLIVFFTIVLWSVSIPLWNGFFQYVERLENHWDIFLICIQLFPFYVFYALCVVPDSSFIGLGKTYYNAVNSLIINLVYYGVFFVLYVTNSITFNMTTIILMFGFGNVVHAGVSYVEQYILVRKIRGKERVDVPAETKQAE